MLKFLEGFLFADAVPPGHCMPRCNARQGGAAQSSGQSIPDTGCSTGFFNKPPLLTFAINAKPPALWIPGPFMPAGQREAAC